MNNKKYNQIIDEVYERYWDSIKTSQYDGFGPTSIKLPTLTKQDFINRCKTDSKFSEKWGLKIEEREVLGQVDQTNPILKGSTALYPRKLITITYNNETIEIDE